MLHVRGGPVTLAGVSGPSSHPAMDYELDVGVPKGQDLSLVLGVRCEASGPALRLQDTNSSASRKKLKINIKCPPFSN